MYYKFGYALLILATVYGVPFAANFLMAIVILYTIMFLVGLLLAMYKIMVLEADKVDTKERIIQILFAIVPFIILLFSPVPGAYEVAWFILPWVVFSTLSHIMGALIHYEWIEIQDNNKRDEDE